MKKTLAVALTAFILLTTGSIALASPEAEPYRSKGNDVSLYASAVSERIGEPYTGTQDTAIMGDMAGFRIPSLIRSVTSDPNDQDVLVAAIDQSNAGADWGKVNIAIRRSFDNGETWVPLDSVLKLPSSKAPQSGDDWKSAFYIDPIISQAANGDLVMLVDMWPECKGLHKYHWLDEGTGYVTVDGKTYQALYTGTSRTGDNIWGAKGKTFTIRENGWVYDNKGTRTNYYLPQQHSAEYGYETMGDLYYAVGEPDYLNKTPPLVPQEPAGDADIYVGNIYLNYKKPGYSKDKPAFVQKTEASPSEGSSYYTTLQTSAAPLFAPVTQYLWVSVSKDNGETWSQPYDITQQVKGEDEAFLGTGPGVGLTLQHQKDASRNGRILMPVYTLGIAAVIYSDDNGQTWQRCSTDGYPYINNVDECQLIELTDGTVMSFGRQEGKAPTPVSYSYDGGKTWSIQSTTDLMSLKCQKSVVTYPVDSSDPRFAYCEGMTPGKQYVLSSHPSGDSPEQAGRSNGVITLGEVQEDHTIRWIAERRLELDDSYPAEEGTNPFFGYSCLTVLENGNIGVLAESKTLCYGSFNLEWLFSGSEPGTVTPIEPVSAPTLQTISLNLMRDNALTCFVKPGVSLEFTVHYSEPVTVSDTPALAFTMDGKEKEASYVSGSGSKDLRFAYQVQKGDTSKEYPVITANPALRRAEGVTAQGGAIQLLKTESVTLYNTAKPHNVFLVGSIALRSLAYVIPIGVVLILAIAVLIVVKVRAHNRKKRQAQDNQ